MARLRGISDWWRAAVAVSFAVAVIRSAVPSSGSEYLWYAAQFSPILGAGILMVLKRHPQPRRRIDWALIYALGAVAATAFLSITFSMAPVTSAQQAVILTLMLSFLAATYLWRWQSAEVIRGDMVWVFGLLVATLLAGFVAFTISAPFTIGNAGRFQGVLSNPNYAGMLACIALPLSVFAFRSGYRSLAVVGAALAAITVVLSGSRGSMAAVAVGVVVAVIVLLPTRKSLIVAATVVAAALASAIMFGATILRYSRIPQTDFTSGRTGIYALMIQEWQRSPIIGSGYRTTEVFAGGFAGHNTYLSVLTETGILGACALAAVIVCISVAGKRGGLLGAVAAIAVMELTESSVFGWGGVTALVSWLILLAYASLGRVADGADLDGAVGIRRWFQPRYAS